MIPTTLYSYYSSYRSTTPQEMYYFRKNWIPKGTSVLVWKRGKLNYVRTYINNLSIDDITVRHTAPY